MKSIQLIIYYANRRLACNVTSALRSVPFHRARVAWRHSTAIVLIEDSVVKGSAITGSAIIEADPDGIFVNVPSRRISIRTTF